MKQRIGWLLAGAVMVAALARASVIVYNAALVDEAALAHDATYTVDIQSIGINAMSAQAVYSSATIADVAFGDGAQSQGSITVANYALLTAAKASNNLTVVSTTGLEGASVIVPGFVFAQGRDWSIGATPALTATSIKNALSQVPFLSVSSAGNVVYATAAANGTYYNSAALVTSVPSILSVATPFFTGGRDNAVVTVNGKALMQGTQWTASVSSAVTATSLAGAINTALGSVLTATANSPTNGIVALKSVLNGATRNFPLASSVPAALSVSAATMTGGVAPAVSLGGHLISAPAHGLSLALPVLYSAGSGAIGGLTNQTTYYAIPLDANSLSLASSQANALLGTYLVFTSTLTSTAANSYELAPLPIGGTPSFKWQVSNNGLGWTDLAVSSVTVSSYVAPYDSTIWSFGYIGLRYLRLVVVAPTSGGLALNVRMIGTN